jgi:hypothetical protein
MLCAFRAVGPGTVVSAVWSTFGLHRTATHGPCKAPRLTSVARDRASLSSAQKTHRTEGSKVTDLAGLQRHRLTGEQHDEKGFPE